MSAETLYAVLAEYNDETHVMVGTPTIFRESANELALSIFRKRGGHVYVMQSVAEVKILGDVHNRRRAQALEVREITEARK